MVTAYLIVFEKKGKTIILNRSNLSHWCHILDHMLPDIGPGGPMYVVWSIIGHQSVLDVLKEADIQCIGLY